MVLTITYQRALRRRQPYDQRDTSFRQRGLRTLEWTAASPLSPW
ncbi:MAG TPA: hypothetical protein VJM51_02145 [Dehalococcoidia bacterium]|nr:hypothetical protein [Dehalococcoidia bacterium]